MSRNVLKWSCSTKRLKQLQPDFSEVLGHVNDARWKLKISTDPLSQSLPFPGLIFTLIRKPSDESVKVTTTVISCDAVSKDCGSCRHEFSCNVDFSKDLIFYSGTETSTIFKLNKRDLLLGLHLQIFFFFKDEPTPIAMLQHLSDSFRDMFEKEQMADVVLKCDSVTLKAHKCILSSQSPVFEALFASSVFERKMETVVIKDINPSVFQVMISFMYSGQIQELSESLIFDLMKASDRYKIGPLKKACLKYLKFICSHRNAVKILGISSLSDRQLKLHCLNLIRNNFEDVKLTEDWEELKVKNPALALEVYYRYGLTV